jgi:DNA invertase Pin-like site-specific DNA recombinase
MNVALYARAATRISSEADLSIDLQVKEMQAYCIRSGWNIVTVFREPGASGLGENRPVFLNMLHEATKSSRPFDTILTTTTSRFSRNVAHAHDCERLLKKSGVGVVAINSGGTDASRGKAIQGILELFGQHESFDVLTQQSNISVNQEATTL